MAAEIGLRRLGNKTGAGQPQACGQHQERRENAKQYHAGPAQKGHDGTMLYQARNENPAGFSPPMRWRYGT